MGYAKVYDRMWTGSLRGKGDVIAVFVFLLAHASRDGTCDVNYQTIVDATGWDESRIRAAIRDLSTPDPLSRTADEDGRRIVPLRDNTDWGWLIVNYGKYRHLEMTGDKREQDRLRQKKKRDLDREMKALSASNTSHVTSRDGSVTGGLQSQIPDSEEPSRDRHVTSRVFGSVCGTCTEGSTVPENPDELLKHVLNVCGMRCIPEDFVRMVFAYWFRRSGRDSNGHDVEIVRYVIGRWMSEQVEWRAGTHREQQRCKANGANGGPAPKSFPPPPHVQLKVLEEEIAGHSANPENPFKSRNPTDLEKAAYRALRTKRDELRKQIANA